MPRFHFDIDDGTTATEDLIGLDLPDRNAAKREAIAALAPVATDVLPDHETTVISVTMRDERQRAIFHATLTLVAEWLE